MADRGVLWWLLSFARGAPVPYGELYHSPEAAAESLARYGDGSPRREVRVREVTVERHVEARPEG
ncbi:MAG: hypothetical protein R3181_00195 [Rubricoccaceae bacterium]|nr:hypothetical protein [Rubricoccaceae bacterium]